METKQLRSGEEIPIIEGTVFFHQCCGCSLIHEVHVEKNGDHLVTRWYRRDKPPTTEELLERGSIHELSDQT